MHLRRSLLAALIALALAAPVHAQRDSARADRLLTHTFTVPSQEFVRIRLEQGRRYQARIEGSGRSRVEVLPVNRGVQVPRVRRTFTGDRISVLVIEPRVTSEYEIRVLGGGARSVRLVIDRLPPAPPPPVSRPR